MARRASKSLRVAGDDEVFPFDGAAADVIGQCIAEAVDELRKELGTRLAKLEEQPTLRYCGPWKSGNAYARGSFVSHSGSPWHSNVDANTAKPGEGDGRWQLVVKRGRDA